MNHEKEATVPVLIVGAGPAGFTITLSLARMGLEFRLIDQKDDIISKWPALKPSSSQTSSPKRAAS